MKLYLKNHTERYPVEQLQLQLFAQEPSEFCTEPFTGDGTVSSLSRGKHFLTATAKVTYRGRTGFASNRVRLEDADVRATRRILQRSYYLAAMQVLDAVPPWARSPACGRRSFRPAAFPAAAAKKTPSACCARPILSLRRGQSSASTPRGIPSRPPSCLTRTIFRYISGSRSARRAARTARS